MDDLEKLRCEPSRMHNVLYFILGRSVWSLYKKTDKIGRFLFRKFGVKFVWLDYFVRSFKIASHIEIYDFERNIVNIDGDYMFFYPDTRFHSHYQYYSKSSKSYEELQKLLCPVEGLNIKF